MTVSKRLRYEILRRDDHTCRYCGGKAPDVAITIDHVLPVALGGTDTAGNLVAACKDCNAGKSSASADSALVAQVSDDAVRWGRAVEVAAGTMRDLRDGPDMAAFDIQWDGWTWGPAENRQTFPRAADWRTTVAGFMLRGLTINDLFEFVNVAAEKTNRRYRPVDPEDVWRYFCGICNRTLEDIQEQAREQFAADIAAEKALAAARAEREAARAAARRYIDQGEPTPDRQLNRGLPMWMLYAS